jgi:hypothetical protein
MTIRLNVRWLLVPVLFLALQISRAQAPQGFYDYSFAGDSLPVWDLTGDYNVTLPVFDKNGTETDVSFGFSMAQNAKGTLSGTGGPTAITIGSDFVAGFYRVTGKVTSGSRVSLVIRITGDGFFGGRTTSSSYSLIVVLADAFISEGQIVSGGRPAVVQANIKGLGSLSGKADFSTAIPDNMDGSWDLTLNIGATLAGTGTVSLSNGRQLILDLKGKYSPQTGLAKLALKGTAENSSVGSQAKVVISSVGDLLQVQGSLLGQKVLF